LASQSWHHARDLACVRTELRAQCFGLVLACEGFEDFDERLIRDTGGALWIAMAYEYASFARADDARQLLAESRLADTRLANQHDEPAVTASGSRLECSLQLAQLALTANEGLAISDRIFGQLWLIRKPRAVRRIVGTLPAGATGHA
jgi:hypothetical protein